MKADRRASQFLGISSEIIDIPRNAKILDLGCGNGNLVFALKEKRHRAFGCDFKFKEGVNVETLQKENTIRQIASPYILPFQDNYFDLVFSDNVFEHVMDYQTTISEIYRVLRPGGGSLHFFSSRYRFLEVHRFVPLGSIIKSKSWLTLWANLGIKSENQKKNLLTTKEIIEDNYNYLNNCTNYLKKRELIDIASALFNKVLFVENYFLKHSDRGKYVYHACRYFPFLASLYSTFRTRVMFCCKEKSEL